MQAGHRSGRSQRPPSARSDQTPEGIAVDARSGSHAYRSPPAKSQVRFGAWAPGARDRHRTIPVERDTKGVGPTMMSRAPSRYGEHMRLPEPEPSGFADVGGRQDRLGIVRSRRVGRARHPVVELRRSPGVGSDGPRAGLAGSASSLSSRVELDRATSTDGLPVRRPPRGSRGRHASGGCGPSSYGVPRSAPSRERPFEASTVTGRTGVVGRAGLPGLGKAPANG